MSTPTSNTEPTKIASGSTVSWTKSLSLYPATSYTLGYKLVGTAGVSTASVVESGSEYIVTLTTALAAGMYRLVGWIVDGSSKISIYEGEIEVTANLIDATVGVDTRSYWQQLLDAIKAVTLNRASIIQSSMTVPGAGGRSIQYLTADELYKWQKRCEYEIAVLKDKERVEQGKSRKKILIQFQ
jgi:hypothetical protein